MRKLVHVFLVAGALVMAGCTLPKMVKRAKDQNLTVTPNPLELHNDTVAYNMSVTLPVKMLKKGTVYTVNSFYKYGEQEKARQAWAASVQAGRLRVPFIVVGLLVCVALAAMVSRHGTLWQGDLASLSPVPAAQLQQDESLRRDLGANDAGQALRAAGAGQEAELHFGQAHFAEGTATR